jgi:hypothetical protein
MIIRGAEELGNGLVRHIFRLQVGVCPEDGCVMGVSANLGQREVVMAFLSG